MQHLPESDWKKFKPLLGEAHERFCARVLDEIRQLVADESQSPHDRFLGIQKLVREQNKELDNSFGSLRRSSAIGQLRLMKAYGLIDESELAQFTDETRDRL